MAAYGSHAIVSNLYAVQPVLSLLSSCLPVLDVLYPLWILW